MLLLKIYPTCSWCVHILHTDHKKLKITTFIRFPNKICRAKFFYLTFKSQFILKNLKRNKEQINVYLPTVSSIEFSSSKTPCLTRSQTPRQNSKKCLINWRRKLFIPYHIEPGTSSWKGFVRLWRIYHSLFLRNLIGKVKSRQAVDTENNVGKSNKEYKSAKNTPYPLDFTLSNSFFYWYCQTVVSTTYVCMRIEEEISKKAFMWNWFYYRITCRFMIFLEIAKAFTYDFLSISIFLDVNCSTRKHIKRHKSNNFTFAHIKFYLMFSTVLTFTLFYLG